MSKKNPFVTDELREKRTRAGRKGRGVSAIGNSETLAGRPNKQKARELQARIDMVVAMAKASELGPAVDVMYGSHYRIRHGSLKAFKVG